MRYKGGAKKSLNFRTVSDIKISFLSFARSLSAVIADHCQHLAGFFAGYETCRQVEVHSVCNHINFFATKLKRSISAGSIKFIE